MLVILNKHQRVDIALLCSFSITNFFFPLGLGHTPLLFAQKSQLSSHHHMAATTLSPSPKATLISKILGKVSIDLYIFFPSSAALLFHIPMETLSRRQY
jgi:hypothetical protein